MAHQRAALELILANWRDVERRLADAEPGTPQVEWLQAEAARLRDEYRALLDPMHEDERTPGRSPRGCRDERKRGRPTAAAGRPLGGSGLESMGRDGRPVSPGRTVGKP